MELHNTEEKHLGWGNYAPRQKSNEQLALERRRELGNKFYSDIDELVQLAAQSKKKVKRLPPGPPLVDDIPEPEPSLTGPCQLHVQHWKERRAVKNAGQVAAVVDDEPVLTERQQALIPVPANVVARGDLQKIKVLLVTL